MVFLTIGICVKNEMGKIEKTLSHLEKQSNKSCFEAVFVDGRSTDGTYEYLRNYMDSATINVKLFREKGGRTSTGNARNIVLDNCSGEYIIFLNADMIVGSDFTRKICQLIRKYHDYDIIRFKPKPPKVILNDKVEKIVYFLDVHTLDRYSIVKKKKHPHYDPELSFGEDKEIGIRWALSGLSEVETDCEIEFAQFGIHNINDYIARYKWYGRTSIPFFKKIRYYKWNYRISVLISWIAIPLFPLGILFATTKYLRKLALRRKQLGFLSPDEILLLLFMEIISVFSFSYGFWESVFSR